MKIAISFITIMLLCFQYSQATELKKVTNQVNYPGLDDMRCEKLTGISLKELKEKLVENCDLNRPFSSSLSRILNEDTYLYCCQIKK